MALNGNNGKDKFCKEFFPNCNHCNVFSACFPDNGLFDESSELALLEQLPSLWKPKS